MLPIKPFRIVAGCLFLASSIYFILHFQDDAFIHLRYAQNLVSFGIPCYNPGQPSYGTSSPLYLYMLAALIKLGITTPWTTKAISLLFHGVLVYQFAWMTQLAKGRKQLMLAASTLLLCMPMSARWLNNGMETSIIAVLATTAGLGVFRPDLFKWSAWRWFWLGFFACTVRIEFFALFAIALAQFMLMGPTSRRPHALGLVLGMLASIAQYMLVFGTLTPDTAIAKSSGFSLLMGIKTFVPTSLSVAGNVASATTLGMGLALILVAAGIETWRNRAARPVLLLNWLGLLGLIFMISARGQAIQGVRYFVFIIFYFAGTILLSSGGKVVNRAKPAATPATSWSRLATAMVVLFLLDAVLSWPVVHGRSQTTLAFMTQNLQVPDDTDCIGYDIGYFTYFTHCRIHDMAGLVNGRQSASMRTDVRLRSFVGQAFTLAYVNEGQLSTLEQTGILSRQDYDIIAANEFPNVGYWRSRDGDRHVLLKRKAATVVGLAR
ncbi:MAG: hypothetical protein QM749_17855 [Aquabacterium sp.]